MDAPKTVWKNQGRRQNTPAVTVENIMQQAATCPDIGRLTGALTRTMPRSATSVTRCMSACLPSLCMCSPTPSTISASSVVKHFPGPGCCRATSALTQGPSPTAVWSAGSLLLTGQTCGLTCRHTLAPRTSNVPAVKSHLHSSPILTNI